MELVHGGDVYSYAEAHGGVLPLDLSANINPFGMPPAVREAMREAVDRCDRYPDPLCRALRRAVGEAEGLDPARLFFGNGAAEVLFRLAHVLRPKTALLTAPAFAEYEQSLTTVGCAPRFHTLRAEEGFAVTPRILDALTPALDAVYLCNPNNPTGRAVEPALLSEIAARCAQNGTWLIVDECFLDFLTDGAARTLAGMLESMPRLVLLRAFTKMYAVPGVRLGYCACDPALAGALARAGQPWNVSVVAQACGVAAAGERAFARETARRVAEERAFLAAALSARGLTVYPGDANFLLFHAADAALCGKLAARGVLVRDCSNYRGLGPGDYRTAVRTRPEHERLLAALDEIASGRFQGGLRSITRKGV